MKHFRWHILLAVSLVMMACNKAPSGIIKESDMVDLLVDLHKADAYVDNYPTQFPNDSTRMMLKQSVYLKHGVTQADFDTSLVWYAHNMEVYTDVYRRVIEQLKNDLDRTSNDKTIFPESNRKNDVLIAGVPYYSIDGDTADLWTMPREWMLSQGLKSGFIPFDFDTDRSSKLGDCYELKFKTLKGQEKISSFIAVDYSDGGTAYLNHSYSSRNWNLLSLQSDSTRSVRRIYGYFYYKLSPGDVAYIDSVQLLRTHMNSANYGFRFSVQHVAERNVRRANMQGDKGIPSSAPINNGVFIPKEDINKPSVRRHIKKSPNVDHLPSRL